MTVRASERSVFKFCTAACVKCIAKYMYSKTRTVQIANFQNIGNFVNIHNCRCLGSVGRHLNAASSKNLEIQAYSIVKPKIYIKKPV